MKKKEYPLSKEREAEMKGWKKDYKLREIARLERIRGPAAMELQKIDAQIEKAKKELEALSEANAKPWFGPFSIGEKK